MTNTKFDSLLLHAIISLKETVAVIPKFRNGKKISPGKIPNEVMHNDAWWANHGLPQLYSAHRKVARGIAVWGQRM